MRLLLGHCRTRTNQATWPRLVHWALSTVAHTHTPPIGPPKFRPPILPTAQACPFRCLRFLLHLHPLSIRAFPSVPLAPLSLFRQCWDLFALFAWVLSDSCPLTLSFPAQFSSSLPGLPFLFFPWFGSLVRSSPPHTVWLASLDQSFLHACFSELHPSTSSLSTLRSDLTLPASLASLDCFLRLSSLVAHRSNPACIGQR